MHFNSRISIVTKTQQFFDSFSWKHKLKKKLLFVYKEYEYDHELYAMIHFLKKHYQNIDFLSFKAKERPRENPGLLSAKLYEKIVACKPEVIFTYEKILSLDEIAHICNLGIQLVTYTCGVHTFAYGGASSQKDAIEMLRQHSLYLIPHAPHVARITSEGVNAQEFSFWYEPEWFHPLSANKIYDILFIGDLVAPLNSNRLDLLSYLSQYYKITLVSDVDPNLRNVNCIGSTSNPRKLNMWINQSKLVLGSDRIGDHKSLNNLSGQYIFYEDEFFMRQRAYPVMGAGACYLVERHTEVENKFTDGHEIILWNGYDDLVEKVKQLLSNENEYKWIGMNASSKCILEHSVGVRVNQFVELVTNL